MTANLQQSLDNQTAEVIAVKQQSVKKSKMLRLFGFETSDFHTWHNFVRLMNRPEDPSSLAFFRILFGILMMIDIPNERGMSDTDLVYGDKSQCRFPLFSFIRPLDTSYMVILYAVMFLAALGITLGLRYRISCFIFLTIYWYIFFLDKTTWNNHSYLYGLIGTLLFLTDGNRYMSVDGLVNKSIRNTHVPLWNYTLLRSQVFFVYFIAGLKKIDFDWISGYSMIDLASHWVFDPFKMFLTHDQITVFIVHHGGLFIDLFVGYMLFFDKTRLVGTVISSAFHIMNSRMFNIGMFPYAMLATTCIFYSNDWPKRFFLTARLLRERLDPVTNKFYVSGLSAHCVYDKLKDPTTEKNTKKVINI
jgi:vitamin K-dependent gamma-carboxylase